MSGLTESDTQRSETEPLVVDAQRLAEMRGVNPRHVRRLDASGKLPRGVRLGHALRWPVNEIRAWLRAGSPDRRTWEAMAATRQILDAMRPGRTG